MGNPLCRRGARLDPRHRVGLEQGAVLRSYAAAVRAAVERGELPTDGSIEIDVPGVGPAAVPVLLAIAELTAPDHSPTPCRTPDRSRTRARTRSAAAETEPPLPRPNPTTTTMTTTTVPEDAGSVSPATPGLVATTLDVLDDAPVLAVLHSTSGCWELRGARGQTGRGTGELGSVTPAVASWTEMVERDPSLGQVTGLPPGWVARRDSPTRPWRRSPA